MAGLDAQNILESQKIQTLTFKNSPCDSTVSLNYYSPENNEDANYA